MLKRGFAFEFEIPDGWLAAEGGGRLVVHGPVGEELIVSGALISGEGGRSEVEEVRAKLLGNALASVENAAKHPELVIAKDLRRENGHGPVERWTLHSQTQGGDILFLEAVVASDVGVIVATLEGPNKPLTMDVFRSFLSSVRKANPEN